MRQDHAVGLGVREVEVAAEGVTDLVVQTGAGTGEGRGSEVGAVETARSGLQVADVADDAAQRSCQRPDASPASADRIGSARGAHSESTQWAIALRPLATPSATGRPTDSSGS